MLSGTVQAGGMSAAPPGHPAVTAPPAANGSSAGPARRLIAVA